MRIRVVHETNYTYEQPARGLIQILRLTPRDQRNRRARTRAITTRACVMARARRCSA